MAIFPRITLNPDVVLMFYSDSCGSVSPPCHLGLYHNDHQHQSSVWRWSRQEHTRPVPGENWAIPRLGPPPPHTGLLTSTTVTRDYAKNVGLEECQQRTDTDIWRWSIRREHIWFCYWPELANDNLETPRTDARILVPSDQWVVQHFPVASYSEIQILPVSRRIIQIHSDPALQGRRQMLVFKVMVDCISMERSINI